MTAADISPVVVARAVRGTSMRPLLRSGQRVGILPVAPTSIRPGDIVAFQAGQRVILHRVIDARRDGGRLLFREKGDNRSISSIIDAGQVLGKALWMADRGARTNLDKPAGLRLRLIVLLSRVECAVFDALRAGWLRTVGSVRPRTAIRILRVVNLILLPAKIALSPLYFSLYRPDARAREDERARAVLAAIRNLYGSDGATRPFPGGSEWDAVLEATAMHGIDAPLYDDLLKACPDGPPSAAVSLELQVRRYRGALQYGAAVSSLDAARRSLAKQGIPFVVLKGPPLAAELYADPSVRPSADVDLLVRKRDVDRALAALTAETHKLYGSGASRAFARRSHFHLVLDPLDRRHTKIELHWDLVDRANLYRVDSEAIFGRTREVEVEGATYTVPGLEDSLIYLCLHAAKHGLFNAAGVADGRPPAWFCGESSGNRLIWFVDLHLYLARHGGTLDWQAVRGQAIRWNVFDEVGDTLRVLDLLLPGSHADAALRMLGVAAATHIATDTGRSPRKMGRLLSARNGLVIRPARLLTMRSFLLPSPAHMMRYYGATSRWMLPVLYVRHPFHMARRLFAA